MPLSTSVPPASRRTAWHPLFVRILRVVLPQDRYDVTGEYLLGAQPQRLDVVIVRKDPAAPPPQSPVLRPLHAHLGLHTLIEFKGPTDVLDREDFLRILGYAAQYAAALGLYDRHQIHLMVVASRLSQPFRELAEHYDGRPGLLGRGVHLLSGLAHPLYVIETEETGDHVLHLCSRAFVRDPAGLFSLMDADERIIFSHVFGEVEQFRRRSPGPLAYADYEEFAMSMQEFIDTILDKLPKEDLLRHLSPEDLLGRLSPEQRLTGLSPEERLKGLSPEEREHLRQLLSH